MSALTRYVFNFFILSFLLPSLAWAGAVITYHGRLLDTADRPVERPHVTFRIRIYSPNPAKCLLYEESRNINMTSSQGVFVIPIGDGDGSRTGNDPGLTIEKIFSNESVLISNLNCNSTDSYTPQTLDQRQMVVSYDDHSGYGWDTLPSMLLSHVPFAVSAHDSQKVGGTPAKSLLRVIDPDTNNPAFNTPPLTPSGFNELMSLINGTSLQYESIGKLKGQSLPALANDEALGWKNGAWTAIKPLTSINETDPSVKTFAKQDLPNCNANEFLTNTGGVFACTPVSGLSGGTVTSISAGTGLKTDQAGNAAITNSGVLSVDVGTSAGHIIQLDSNAKLPSVDGSQLLNVHATTAVTATTASNLSNTANINTTGTITASSVSSTGDIVANGRIHAGAMLTSKNLYLYDNKPDPNTKSIGLKAPADVPLSYVLTLPSSLGTSGQVLGMSSVTGELSWINPSSGSVTSVAATSPLASSGGNTPTISISQASAIQDGYLSQSDYASFTNKANTNDPRFTDSRTPTGNAGGDLSGTYPDPTVGKIKGQNILGTAIATGQVLRFDSGQWQPSAVKLSELAGVTGVVGSAFNISTCGSHQTLLWSSLTDSFTCVGISITMAQVSDAGLLAEKNNIDLSTSDATGILPIAKGGTGLSTLGSANQFLSVNSAGNSLEYKSFPTCIANQYLTFNGTGFTCANDAGASGTVASLSSTTTALTFSSATGSITANISNASTTTPGLAQLAANGTSTAGTVIQADDSRLTNARAPTGAAGGDLSGTYPNPSLKNTGTSGTYFKVTTDAQGRVTNGNASLSSSDIPNLDWNKITTGKPTSLNGYGITDGVINGGGVGKITSGTETPNQKPATPNTGDLFVATDTQKVYRYGGASWDVIASASGSGGTVTSFSITSGNGFSGTVTNPNSTPSLTLTTSITGMIKGNGTSLSAATAGTDYSAGTSTLSTGLLKNTTGTGALTIANSADIQSTLGYVPVNKAGDTMSGSLSYLANVGSSYTASSGSGKVTLQGPTAPISTNYVLRLPANAPSVTGQALVSDTSGNLSWQSLSSGSVTSVSATSPLISSGGTVPTISLAGLSGLGSANQILGMKNDGSGYEYKNLNGTANQIAVAHAANSLTLSLPQDIHTAASPSFTGLTVSEMNAAGFVKNAADGKLSGGNTIGMADLSGTLPVTKGGTGSTSFATNGVVISGATTTANLTAVNSATTGSVLMTTVLGPAFSTASYPATTSINRLLYSSANNVVNELPTANNAILTTNGSGVPSFSVSSSDLFTQYAALAGRSTAQTLHGSTLASGTLTLKGTSHATPGNILLNTNGGNVGIGTSSPNETLSIYRADAKASLSVVSDNATTNSARYPSVTVKNFTGSTGTSGSPSLTLINSRGTMSSTKPIRSGDAIGSLVFAGGSDTSSNYIEGASIWAAATQNYSATAGGTSLSFYTTSNNTTNPQPRMTVDQSGYVGIGTEVPQAQLSVESTNGVVGLQIKKKGAGAVDTINLINDMDTNGNFWIAKGSSATSVPTSSDGLIKITNEGNVEIYGQAVTNTNDQSGVLGLKTQAGGNRNEVSLEFYANRANLNAPTGYVGYESDQAFNLSLMNSHSTGSLILGTNNSHNFYMDPSGNIGLGTLTPSATLDISAKGEYAKNKWKRGLRLSDSSAIFWAPGTGSLTYSIGQAENGTSSSLYFGRATSEVGNTGTQYYDLVISSNGNIGIGTATPSYTLDVIGDVRATGNVSAWSDLRAKKNIQNIENALDKLTQVRGVTFDWRINEFPNQKFKTSTDMGVIAQEVEKVFPESVQTSPDGFKSVSYGSLVAPLINAIKELHAKFLKHDIQLQEQKMQFREIASKKADKNDVDKKIENLERENQELKERLYKIERALESK